MPNDCDVAAQSTNRQPRKAIWDGIFAAAPNGTVYFCDITNPKPQEIKLVTFINLSSKKVCLTFRSPEYHAME